MQSTGCWSAGFPVRLVLAAAVLFPLLLGCSADRGKEEFPITVAGADSAAFVQAMSAEDGTARLETLRHFVRTYPEGEWAARAWPLYISLVREHEPQRMEEALRDFSSRTFDSPDPYNSVGWDLAVAGEHLDLAIPILEKGVARARAGGDSLALASVLDSEAWARHRKGDHEGAVARMEEAYSIYGPGQDEIDEHMARIYDAAGQPDKAAQIYQEILYRMENPEIRERLTDIAGRTGASMAQIDTEIERKRAERRLPAPDFTMPSLADGAPVSLSNFRGRVVLLNFWHPT